MIRFRFVDQDFFEVDPVRYSSALGEDGIAAYRQAVAAHPGDDSFPARYARKRFAVLDGDVDAIVKLLGGDLSTPYPFVRSPRRWPSLGEMTRRWPGRRVASRRPTAGRPPSCTTWRAPSTGSAGSRSRCSRCDARNTSGCHLSQPMAPCGPPPTRWTPGARARCRPSGVAKNRSARARRRPPWRRRQQARLGHSRSRSERRDRA